MNDQALSPRDPDNRESEIELLARETDTPVDIVHKIYTIERAKLDKVARIKTYVPVLIHRHVKELLQAQRSALLNSIH
jgi:Protein of unknown function (DUF3562)